MNKIRRISLSIALGFAIGTLICSFFMLTSVELHYNGYRYVYYYYVNIYGTSVISLLSVILPSLIVLLVFSRFSKRGFYKASLPINIIETILSILTVVFSSLSFFSCKNRIAPILATVFSSILVLTSILSTIFCVNILSNGYFYRVHSTQRYGAYSKPINTTSINNEPISIGDTISYKSASGVIHQEIDNTKVRRVITNNDEFVVLGINQATNKADIKSIKDSHVYSDVNLNDFALKEKCHTNIETPVEEDITSSEQKVVKESNNEKETILLLREYKMLLDEGIITQEEFDKKKKQILEKLEI